MIGALLGGLLSAVSPAPAPAVSAAVPAPVTQSAPAPAPVRSSSGPAPVPVPSSSGLVLPNFGRCPRDWGMSRACARMVRKNRIRAARAL